MAEVSDEMDADFIHGKIKLLINNMIRIEDTTGQYLLHLPDGRTIDTKGWYGWDWTQGIGLYGIWNYYTLTKRERVRQIIVEWFRHQRQSQQDTPKNINTMAAILTLAYIQRERAEEIHLDMLFEWTGWAMHDLPRTSFGGMQHVTHDLENKGELWVDTLMMTALPLAMFGKDFLRPDYVEEAKRQFLLHAQFLFDSSTGLWFHGWKFEDELTSEQDGVVSLGHNFARARWARGNAWATIAIPEILELLDLPPHDAFRVHMLSLLEAQCRMLKRLQCSSGLWRTLLDIPEEDGNYEESSATAGFAYGISKAVRCGYLDPSYKAVAERAFAAVIEKINDEGELLGTSFGTPVGNDLKHYKDIAQTTMPYGQAMAIIALGEMLRTRI